MVKYDTKWDDMPVGSVYLGKTLTAMYVGIKATHDGYTWLSDGGSVFIEGCPDADGPFHVVTDGRTLHHVIHEAMGVKS